MKGRTTAQKLRTLIDDLATASIESSALLATLELPENAQVSNAPDGIKAWKTQLEAVYEDFRPGDVRHSLADLSTIQDLLGYEPEIDFPSGVRLTLEWFVERKAGER